MTKFNCPRRYRQLGLEALEPRDLLANLTIESIVTVPAEPIAGEPFSIRAVFRHSQATGESYTIGRSVNGRPELSAAPINWGNGRWVHAMNHGSFIFHQAGTYPVTIRLDSGDAIAETDESDNVMTTMVNVVGTVTEEWELIKADQGLNLLGDGTNVIVGQMDDAFDFLHPWFQGNDSLGRPRLVAALQNADGPGGSPLNAGHATSVMGVVLARGSNPGDLIGLAPDARFVTAEFINRANIPDLSMPDVFDAAGFLVEHGAEVINMSWSWFVGSTEQAQRGETPKTSLLADYLAYAHNIVVVPAINQNANSDVLPSAPASSRNVITVGGLDTAHERALAIQNHGPTLDGRSKPDLIGNAAGGVVSTSGNWRNGALLSTGFGGTSLSTPFVTGAAAQMLDFGKRTGQSTDHRVIKAVIMNSGVKTLDSDGSPWSNSETQPLDNEQGTGVLNLVRVHEMYSAGQQSPGFVEERGYDFRAIEGVADESDLDSAGRQIYVLGEPASNGTLDVTLAWDRHTFWDDRNGNERIDSADSFFVSSTDTQDNLDLVLYRDGIPVHRSQSTVDNVEHLHVTDLPDGYYTLHVVRREVPNSGSGEDYALAWHSDVSWQPTGFEVAESNSATTVTEAGTEDSVTVALTAPPPSQVVLTITSSDTSEAEVDPPQLTFTSENWNQPQTVRVIGVDDLIVDGGQSTTLTIAIDVANSHDAFHNLPDQIVIVTTQDDDEAAFTVTETDGSTVVAESGTSDSFTVVLDRQPLADVIFSLTSSDSGEAEVDKPQLTFTPDDWDQPQIVTVVGVDDAAVDGSQQSAVTVSVDDARSHGAFVSLPDQTVTVTTTDDDIAGYAVEETQGATVVTESGDTDSFTVVLTSQPLSNVVLAVNAESSNKVTLDRALLTFTPLNWNQPQVVIVGGIRDELDDGDQEVPVTLSIVSTLSHDAFADLPDRMIVVVVTEGNRAPALAAIGNKHAEEGNLLTFTASATDPDTPANTLTFSLNAGAPPGASIDPQTGVFTWVPTEAQGPGTFNITVRGTDDGTPNLDDFETIEVLVGEVNEPPVLATIGGLSVDEGNLLTFTASATDPDTPANTLTFSLNAGAPPGASIDPQTGVFTWVPTEAQGPGAFNITVRVTDDGTPNLDDFETIDVLVGEVNEPPVLGAIGNKSVDEGSLLTFTASASDPDVPANTLTFSLDAGAPAGASIDPQTGVFTWTPTEAQGPGTYDITIRVADGRTPNLGDFATIAVEVRTALAWHNYNNAFDVNGDGQQNPGPTGDILPLINELNQMTLISMNGQLPDINSVLPSMHRYYDVNNDGFLTATGDVLPLINFVNSLANAEGENTAILTMSNQPYLGSGSLLDVSKKLATMSPQFVHRSLHPPVSVLIDSAHTRQLRRIFRDAERRDVLEEAIDLIASDLFRHELCDKY